MSMPRDFLGQELAVGDQVVYPVTSGYSAQVALGEILSLEWVSGADDTAARRLIVDRLHELLLGGLGVWKRGMTPPEMEEWVEARLYEQGKRAGTVTKARIQPSGLSSRWKHYGAFTTTGEPPKAVTLTKGAPNMVRVNDLLGRQTVVNDAGAPVLR